MSASRFNEPILPMTLRNMRANGGLLAGRVLPPASPLSIGTTRDHRVSPQTFRVWRGRGEAWPGNMPAAKLRL